LRAKNLERLAPTNGWRMESYEDKSHYVQYYTKTTEAATGGVGVTHGWMPGLMTSIENEK